MKKMFFRNSKNWKIPSVTISYRGEEDLKIIPLTRRDSKGDFVLDIDNEKISFLSFQDESGEGSGRIFPGALSIGVDYRLNEGVGRDLTYLFSKDIVRTGRVENHIFRDEKNLYYRDDRSKKISVFLPESYDGVTPHDVLYFFDAQNLFCNAGEYTENGDPYGSWQLDVVISELHRQYGKNIIVVGIDNADFYRSQELFMNPNSFGMLSPFATSIPDDNFSKGHLESLSAFMVGTLHNFIKENYCISENNIGLGGSSMGGIASFFCGIYEMGFFKYVLSYSPAYALYEPGAFENWFKAIDFKKNIDRLPKIHIYSGGGDMLERGLLESSMNMKDLLVRYGYDGDKIFETFDLEKPHNEESWRLILPQSFSYLLNLEG